MKKQLIAILIVMSALCLFTACSSDSKTSESYNYDNNARETMSFGNQRNLLLSDFAVDGNTKYQTCMDGLKRTTLDANKGGTKVQIPKLGEAGACENTAMLNFEDDWIYFLAYFGDSSSEDEYMGSLCKMRKNGTEGKIIEEATGEFNGIMNYAMTDKYIYYTYVEGKNSSVCVMDRNGKHTQNLQDDAVFYGIDSGWIYYTKAKGNLKKSLSANYDKRAPYIYRSIEKEDPEYVYTGLYRMKPDGSNNEEVFDCGDNVIQEFFIDGENLYYIKNEWNDVTNDQKIVKRGADGQEEVVAAPSHRGFSCLNSDGKWLYYIKHDVNDYMVYRVNMKDSKIREKICTFNYSESEDFIRDSLLICNGGILVKDKYVKIP